VSDLVGFHRVCMGGVASGRAIDIDGTSPPHKKLKRHLEQAWNLWLKKVVVQRVHSR
jgi:hypothetical protein